MSNKSAVRLTITLAGIVVIIGAGIWYAVRATTPIERSIKGTILEIDPQARTATLEFIHPKTQQRFPLTGEIADDCAILLNGRPLTPADLRVGMRVEAHGLLYRGMMAPRVVATRVSVLDEGAIVVPTPTSQPAASLDAAGQPRTQPSHATP